FARFSAVVFLSYGLIWRREGGPSYRQWKWISFFQPALAVMAVTVAAIAIERLVNDRIGRRRGLALAVAGVFAVVATANTGAGAVHAVDGRFRVIHDDPRMPTSVSADALGGTLSVRVGTGSPGCGQIEGTLRATNTGRARWLPLSASTGAVTVGVHLLDEHGV